MKGRKEGRRGKEGRKAGLRKEMRKDKCGKQKERTQMKKYSKLRKTERKADRGK